MAILGALLRTLPDSAAVGRAALELVITAQHRLAVALEPPAASQVEPLTLAGLQVRNYHHTSMQGQISSHVQHVQNCNFNTSNVASTICPKTLVDHIQASFEVSWSMLRLLLHGGRDIWQCSQQAYLPLVNAFLIAC